MEGGRAARKKANIKVRQPLSEIKIYETNTDIAEFIKRQEDIILDELNIKRITITDTLEEMGSFTIKPNFKILSSKFGDDMQDAIKDISKMDTYKTMYNYLKNEKLPSENFDIINEDIIPEIKGKEGYESFFSNIIIVEKSKTALDHAMPLGGDEGVLIDGNEVERIMELTNLRALVMDIDKKSFAEFFCLNPVRRRTEVFHQITDILVHVSSKNISALFIMHDPTDETHG